MPACRRFRFWHAACERMAENQKKFQGGHMSSLTTQTPAPTRRRRRTNGISIAYIGLTWLLALTAFAVAAALP